MSFNLIQSEDWRQLFAIALWHIWLMRNTAVFRGLMYHPNHVINKFLNDLSFTKLAFQGTRKEKEVVVAYTSPTWCSPLRGRFKLNTDASFKNGSVAGGGVARCDDGTWVSGFSSKFQARDAQEAQLIAIRFGLEFMKALEIDNYDLEIDAKQIQQLLASQDDFNHHYLAPILKDVEEGLRANRGIEIVHVNREINKVAHGLAKFGMEMLCENSIHDIPPDIVKDDYEEDLRVVHVI